MASRYESRDERDHDRGRYYYEDRQSVRDSKYAESKQYADSRGGRLAPDYPSRALVTRNREDSDGSIEEIYREDIPGYYARETREIRRARSAEPGYYEDDRVYYRAYPGDQYEPYYNDRAMAMTKRATSVYYEEEERKKARVLSKQQQIMAAVTGAVLTLGGKELFDRKQAKQQGTEVHRDLLTTAALGAAGALAGYQGTEFYNKRKGKEEKEHRYVLTKDRHGHVHEYYDEEEQEVDTQEGKAHRNFLAKALTAAGLGSAVKALTGGGHSDDRSETGSIRSVRSSRSVRSRRSYRSSSRSRRTSRSRSRSRSHGRRHQRDASKRIQQAAKASLLAGAAEAFRVSKEPGGWQGEKIKRIFTAAAGAGTIGAAHDQNKGHNKLTLLESVLGGLVGNRVINGSRKDIEEDQATGRSRSRSRARSASRGGNATLAALGAALAGAGANKLYKNRKKSRSRSRRDEFDSPERSPLRRSRSRSVVDSARRQLAKIGIGSGPDTDDDRHNRRSRSRSRSVHDLRDDEDDYDDRDRNRRRRGGGRRDDFEERARKSMDDLDLGDSDNDMRRTRRMRDGRRRN